MLKCNNDFASPFLVFRDLFAEICLEFRLYLSRLKKHLIDLMHILFCLSLQNGKRYRERDGEKRLNVDFTRNCISVPCWPKYIFSEQDQYCAKCRHGFVQKIRLITDLLIRPPTLSLALPANTHSHIEN